MKRHYRVFHRKFENRLYAGVLIFAAFVILPNLVLGGDYLRGSRVDRVSFLVKCSPQRGRGLCAEGAGMCGMCEMLSADGRFSVDVCGPLGRYCREGGELKYSRSMGGGPRAGDAAFDIYRLTVDGVDGDDRNGKFELMNRLRSMAGVLSVQEEQVFRIEGEYPGSGWLEMSGDLDNLRADSFREAVAPLHDPLWNDQWGHRRVGAEGAWGVTRGCEEVVVAIIDSGCDRDHPDLYGRIWVNRIEERGLPSVDDDGNGFIDDTHGWDFVSAGDECVIEGEDPGPPDNEPDDFLGHGTHIAGIVAAAAGNGIGVEGAAPLCRIMVLRAGYAGVDGRGELLEGDIIEAVYYAAASGADIINMSFAGNVSVLLHEVIREVKEGGVVFVAAAGNGGSGESCYPAAYDEVLAVAAVDEMDRLAVFSGYGEWVDCAAPGVSVVSTVPGGYGFISGTSVSCPFVSSCVALLRCLHPDWDPSMIEAQVLHTCEDLPLLSAGSEEWLGYGLCRMDRAVTVEPEPAVRACAFSFLDSLGDRDGVADAGETVVLRIRAENAWLPISEGRVEIGCDDPNVQVVQAAPLPIGPLGAGERFDVEFAMSCSPEMPVDHNASFVLTTTVGDFEGSYSFSLELFHQPSLAVRRLLIEEICGDGDGGADPGERLALKAEIENSGGNSVETVAELLPRKNVSILGNPGLELGDMAEGRIVWAEFVISIDGAAETGGTLDIPLRLSSAGYSTCETIGIWVSFVGDQGPGESPAMLQGDACHSGSFRDGPSAPLGLQWSAVLEGEGSLPCQPVVGNGRVYAVRGEGEGGVVYSFEESSGTCAWRRDLRDRSGNGPSSLAWYRGVCYVGGGEWLQALHGGTGRSVWTFCPEPSEPGAACRVGNPTACAGVIVVGVHEKPPGRREHICAVDPFTGRVLWEKLSEPDKYLPPFAPACSGGKVFVVDGLGRLDARSVESGELLWRRETGSVPAAPVMIVDSFVVVVSTGGLVSAVDVNSGDLSWHTDACGAPQGPPCRGNGWINLVVRDEDGLFCCSIDAVTGVITVIRRLALSDARGAVYSGGCLYIAGGNGEVLWLPIGSGATGSSSYTYVGAGGMGQGLGCSLPFIAGGSIFLAMNGNGDDIVAAIGGAVPDGPPEVPVLYRTFPNPFNPNATILFHLPESEVARVTVHDVSGRLVRTLLAGRIPAGTHRIEWDGKNNRGRRVSAGVYFCVMGTPTVSMSRKMVLLD